MKQSSRTQREGQEGSGQGMRSGASDLDTAAVGQIAEQLNTLLSDVFAIYVKTKNFHWHMSGPHFREYHELLDEQSAQLFAMTDPIAERVRKLGAPTLRSIGQIARLQRIPDSEADAAEPLDMLAELCQDNRALAAALREARGVCERHQDAASAALIDNWLDEAERRAWFLYEISRRPEETRH